MRIIAGRFKGMRLRSSKGGTLRPTVDRVREALFSALGSQVEDARVLDLFAGTGAFGFEAVSRGASSAMLVDVNRHSARVIAETSRRLGTETQVRVLAMDALQAMKHLEDAGELFTIIFLDPPYESEWIAKILSDPVFPELLAPEGIFIVEKAVRSPETTAPPIFRQRFSRKYGGTLVEMFSRA
ncbi:MAG TPA: 16S rRNA (guanine(966)-N(2))-methyltransferase RsmD [Desulfomonilaceae bacterium]|nr:16S rRNA (guanine(966)-N(2))-methyltransferase RsmD [Desulfomonilaceae bacterium]